MNRVHLKRLGAVLLAGALALTGGMVAYADYPELQKPKGERCIKDKEWMRRNHMDFLKNQRELAVREGVRIKEESLLNCKSCHPSREQFCDKCHSYAGVQPDCFTCHTYPK